MAIAAVLEPEKKSRVRALQPAHRHEDVILVERRRPCAREMQRTERVQHGIGSSVHEDVSYVLAFHQSDTRAGDAERNEIVLRRYLLYDAQNFARCLVKSFDRRQNPAIIE